MRLSLHYKIPLFPRVMRGIIQLFTAGGMFKEAIRTLKDFSSDKIDEFMITSIFDGCVKHRDISSAASLIKVLEEKGVQYRLNIVFKWDLDKMGMSKKFGKNC
ncbi:unnamed protein product [Arabis nemorensis]|uniref:Pentatricopeptide repeat-containing protein n=1 Tax=Arabis nemorensis TaxID=586526 RepID=A0A565C6A8_9BRAS|nr:unnamed protein product [Arabis nemorensis]